MRHLLAIAYPDLIQAEHTRLKILEMQKEYLLQLEDIVIAVKQLDGKLKLNQAVDLTAAGAVQGGFLGLLVGLLFLNPLLGIAVGAVSGAVAGALGDIGIDDEMMREMATELNPGGAILFVLAYDITLDRVLADLAGAGGKVIRTSLCHDDETALQKALASAQLSPLTARAAAGLSKISGSGKIAGPMSGKIAEAMAGKDRKWSVQSQQATVTEAKEEWRNEGNPN
ncbi:MAG: DUF1269 domain-containing protein [Candidatus Sericytochromatia bacterium]